MRLEILEGRCLPSVNVFSYHNDSSLTGQNLNEMILTPASVNASQFGLLFVQPVDGNVYAQPLYMSSIGNHNVVFVATEHDSVYAFDADTPGAPPLWKDSFINPAAGVTTVPSTDVNTGAITPEIGITSTPVVDPSTGTLYVVALTKEVSGTTTAYVQRLHALDVATGTEKFGGPVVIQGSVPGIGNGSVNGVLTFDPRIQLQRPGLLLLNSTIYVAWGSYDDQFNYHGWVMGFNAQTLQRTAIWNSTPNASEGGIWMAGGGVAADSQGNLYVTIGNGTFDANTGGHDYGDSVVKLSTSGGALTVADYFTPYNQSTLNAQDLDIGSGGAMLLPDQPGAHPQLLTTSGKQGTIYLLDRTNLGQFNAAGDNIVQSLPPAHSYNGNFSTPAYFNGTVYYHESADYLRAFQLSNGLLPATPTSQSLTSFNFPGVTPSISANGTANGIVWEWQYANPGVLHAYLASNVADELYNSALSGLRDLAGAGVKFAVPTIANGKVYVGTQSGLAVFGLFPAATAPPSAPSSLIAVAQSATQVTLSWVNTATNQIEFKIERSTDNVNFSQINTLAAGVTSYIDSSAAGSTTYYYRVRASNTAGDSADSNTATVTTPPAPNQDPALVGYWPFDEGAGTTTADLSGNHDNGTILGEVTWIGGQVGPGALSFHGIGNQNPHVDVPDNPVLDFAQNQSFSVAAWVDLYSLQDKWVGIVAKSRDVAPIYGIWIDPNNDWVFGGSSSAPGGGNIVGSAATVGWHYVAAVQDGVAGTRSLYVDGSPVATGPAEAANGTGDLWIGGANSPDSEYFNGAIDDVRIYNRALSISDIQSLAPALAATYSSSPPTLWAGGATKSYSITVKNVGTQTWNATGTNIVRLGVEFGTTSDWPGDGWATDQRFFLPSDVPSGGTVTLNVAVTAPLTGSTYVLRHRMVKENVAWFDQMQKTPVVVDATPPTVLAVSPANGAVGVLTTAEAQATFSEAVDPTTLTTGTFYVTRAGSTMPIAATVSYDPLTKTATLLPSSLLATGAGYTATVKGGATGVRDLAGNPLAADFTWSFTTTTVPAYAASFVAQSVPATMVAGHSYSVSVAMMNTGTNAWTYAAGYKLGSWNPRDNVTWGLNRVLLPPGGSVAPGATWTFAFTVKAPTSPGKYNFQWRMLQELVVWFGSASPNISITVNPATLGAAAAGTSPAKRSQPGTTAFEPMLTATFPPPALLRHIDAAFASPSSDSKLMVGELGSVFALVAHSVQAKSTSVEATALARGLPADDPWSWWELALTVLT